MPKIERDDGNSIIVYIDRGDSTSFVLRLSVQHAESVLNQLLDLGIEPEWDKLERIWARLEEGRETEEQDGCAND